MPETKKTMIVQSPSLMYEVHHHTPKGQRVIDTDKLSTAGQVRRYFVGDLPIGKFGRYYILKYIRDNSRWKNKHKVDLENSKLSIKPLMGSQYRLAFWVDDMCASWKQMGFRPSQLKLFSSTEPPQILLK